MENINVFKDLVVVEVFSNVFNGLALDLDPIVVVEQPLAGLLGLAAFGPLFWLAFLSVLAMRQTGFMVAQW